MKSRVLIIVLLLPGLMPALDPSIHPSQYCLRTWSVSDGLPQSTILKILQTRDGYIWLGTWGGLVRFDGIRFRVFSSVNTPEIENNTISHLHEDEEGNLWIATDRGLLCYRDGHFHHFGREEGLIDDRILFVSPGGKNEIWIVTRKKVFQIRNRRIVKTWSFLVRGGPVEITWGLFCKRNRDLSLIGSVQGLFRLTDGGFVPFSRESGLDRIEITSLSEDDSGRIWVAAKNGLHSFSGTNHQFFSAQQHPFLKSIRLLFMDRTGLLWLTTSGGVYSLRLDPSFKPVFSLLIPQNVNSVFWEDRQNNVWYGGGSGGLIRLSGGKKDELGEAEGLPHKDMYSLFEDREGNLWIGTFRGLARLQNPKVTVITTREGLSNDRVRSVFQDREGAVWVGTDGSRRDRFLNGVWSHYPANGEYGFLQDRRGDIWMGSNRGKLQRYSGGMVRTVRDLAEYHIEQVYTFCEDRAGTIWIGTSNGLLSYSDGRLVHYPEANGKPLGFIQVIHEQEDGSLLIASQQGLFGFNDGVFHPIHSDPELAKMWIRAIYQDSRGVIWMGTDFGGLLRLQRERLTHYTEREGLVDSNVSAILEDGHSNLWISCNRGIYRVAKRELNDFAAGRIAAIHCISYGRNDGMLDEECNGGYAPSAWKCRDGSMWFPTQKGIAVIRPDRLQFNVTPPAVYIEGMTADERTIDHRLPLQLEAGTQRIEFRYTAICFSGPEKIRFRYRLDGVDPDWIEAGTHRNAYYTNVPSGRYRFRVIACNDEGVWNETGASWEFLHKPFFYQTLWFRLTVGGMALLLVGIAFVLRSSQLKKRSAHLESLVALRTDELKDANKLLSEKIGNIEESIRYAREIQQSLFPKELECAIPRLDHFLILESKEEVSGDFFWFFTDDDVLICAAADCTGHGVPGAMLSVAGFMLLNQVVGNEGLREPAAIIERIDHLFLRLFQSRRSENCFHDGIDIILSKVDPKNATISFAGAGRPIYLVQNGILREIGGAPHSIGMPGRLEPFRSQTEALTGNDMVFLATDGFSSQLNIEGVKFGSRTLKQRLQQISGLPLPEQQRQLQSRLREFMGKAPRTDDITLIGIRILPEP